MEEKTQASDLLKKNDFVKLIKHIFVRQTSAFIIIFGRRGSGKTDLGLKMMELLNQLGIIKHFATNVGIIESKFPIERITNLEDLKFWCKSNDSKKMFLFDEVAKALPRRSPMASLTIKLINEFQVMRKYKLSTVATTIDSKYADKSILGEDILDGYWIKESWKNPKLASYIDYLEDLEIGFSGIPATSVQYNTWDSALFLERSQNKKPIFKERDLEIIWEWSHGKSIKDLGIHAQQLNRIVRKFTKEVMERDHHISQPLERAANNNNQM